MTDYRTGDFLIDGNGLFQITATKESYFLLDVNEGTLILANGTEAGLVKTYESLYDCHLQRVTKDYAATYIGGPSREFINGEYYLKLNGAYLGEQTEHGYELVTDKMYAKHFKGPAAYEVVFHHKNKYGGKVIRVNELEVDYVPNSSLFDDDEENEEDYY